jgi:hypothetical protein
MRKQYLTRLEIEKQYSISKRTFFRKLSNYKNLHKVPTEFMISSGNKHLYNSKVIDSIFIRERKPKRSKKQIFKDQLSQRKRFTYFGGFRGKGSSSKGDHECLIYLTNELRKFSELKYLKLLYVIEKNPNDQYYHTHFIMYGRNTQRNLSLIERNMKLYFDKPFIEVFDRWKTGDNYLRKKLQNDYLYGILPNRNVPSDKNRIPLTMKSCIKKSRKVPMKTKIRKSENDHIDVIKNTSVHWLKRQLKIYQD